MAYDLKELRSAADVVADKCLRIALASGFSVSCVNWGDFGCVSAEHYVTEDGDEGYRVYFEEADPSNREVGEFIRMSLEEAGFPDVEVIFEW